MGQNVTFSLLAAFKTYYLKTATNPLHLLKPELFILSSNWCRLDEALVGIKLFIFIATLQYN